MDFARLALRAPEVFMAHSFLSPLYSRPAGLHCQLQGTSLSRSSLVQGPYWPRRRRVRLFCSATQSGEQGLPSSSSASSSSSTGKQTSSGTASSSNQGPDYYKQASQRLQGLLAGVGDGEEELVNGIIMDQTPEQKVRASGS